MLTNILLYFRDQVFNVIVNKWEKFYENNKNKKIPRFVSYFSDFFMHNIIENIIFLFTG